MEMKTRQTFVLNFCAKIERYREHQGRILIHQARFASTGALNYGSGVSIRAFPDHTGYIIKEQLMLLAHVRFFPGFVDG